MAAQDARRAERRQAAQLAPLGESIHTLQDIRSNKPKAVPENTTQPQPTAPTTFTNPLEAASTFLQPSLIKPSPITPAPNQPILTAGSIIPAALITQIKSELPGLVKAQVTEDVYDTVTGYKLLIPRGSTLLGSYGQNTSSGQSRLFVYWTRLMYPNGAFLDLAKTGGVDADGSSGVVGRRQTGFLSTLLGATLINLVQNVGQTSTTSSDLTEAARVATGASVGSVTSQYLEQRFNRGPRFTVKAGTIVNVMLENDYYLPEWRR